MIIHVRDFRAAGICTNSRFWFEKHGLDWRDFIRNGIDSEKLRATGDHLDLIMKLEEIAGKDGRQ